MGLNLNNKRPLPIKERTPRIDTSGAILSDWKAIIDDGTRKLVEGSAQNTTTTIYTVPAGKIFYAIGTTLSADMVAAAGRGAADIRFNDEIVVKVVLPAVVAEHDSQSISFTIPIKLVAGETIKIVSSRVDISVNGQVQGFELKT